MSWFSELQHVLASDRKLAASVPGGGFAPRALKDAPKLGKPGKQGPPWEGPGLQVQSQVLWGLCTGPVLCGRGLEEGDPPSWMKELLATQALSEGHSATDRAGIGASRAPECRRPPVP